MSANLILLKPSDEPSDEQIQRVLDKLIQSHLADFAQALWCARVMSRAWPELVTAPELPQDLLKAYVNENGSYPDDALWESYCRGADPLGPNLREKFLPEAREEVLRQMAKDRNRAE
jgi:hypothetical protein